MSPEVNPFTFGELFKWLLSALGGIALWVASVFHKRLEAGEKSHLSLTDKVRDVEYMSVSRTTYHTHVKDTQDAFDAIRKESMDREQRIILEIRSVRTDLQGRIDSLFQRSER